MVPRHGLHPKKSACEWSPCTGFGGRWALAGLRVEGEQRVKPFKVVAFSVAVHLLKVGWESVNSFN